MALADYFKGPKHKSEATRLQAELAAFRMKSQADFQWLQQKYDELEAKAREVGALELIVVQARIKAEEDRLAALQSQSANAQAKLESAQAQLLSVQQQILGAEDTVQLESFALYTPKYRLTNSAEYKARLDVLREDQKQTARGLSAEVDAWESHAVSLTKAQWKKLRKDALKLALRSFNSESEYCVENVKFSNLEKMEERIRRSFETCNRLLTSVDAWWKDIVLERKLQELHLAHEYQVKRQEEKEAARQAREDLREQEKLEKEIREARAKIDKERRHFLAAMQKLQQRLAASKDTKEREDLPPRQNSCRLHRTTQGAAMKDGLGSIRTGIQGQGGSEVAAAGERCAGTGGAGSWRWSGNPGALARGRAVQARPRAGLDCGRAA